MPASVRIKICGLTEAADVAAAVAAGAAYVGFVLFPPSPRSLSLAAARALALEVPPGVAKVALTVDADDTLLDALCAEVPLDMLQLHGAESPARVREVKARHGLPVMKAIGLAGAADLAQIDRYAGVADQLLIDAKPPPGASRPGGNATAFDWALIEGRDWPLPWLLAGGLTPDNVAEAVRRSDARQLDVSSGVECAPGRKDPALIRAFVEAARAA
ncbi:MAG: phosphoribosylanthranilate isomerase [Roseovarius sp.]|nr:phosphoribosylanthranilate isomerase [Roseovarius sp.]MBK44750.1 phosphoribosylanthranilate isomerase [Roseovarius sp.]